MEKTMTLNLRVNPTVKQQAEDVLKQLGIPMATAIDTVSYTHLGLDERAQHQPTGACQGDRLL